MTKTEIIAILAERTGISRADARLFLDKFNETLFQGLNDDQLVKIKGLGTFKMVSVKARKSVNVNGGEAIEIPAHNKVTFTAEKLFAEMVNEPLSHLDVVELNDEPSADDNITEEEDDNFVASARMRKLSEDAEELKGLLADINGLQSIPAAEAPTENAEVETPAESPAEIAEPEVEEPEQENVEPHIPEPEPEVEKPAVETPPEPHDDDTYTKEYEESRRGMTHGGKMGRIFLWSMVFLLIIFAAIYWANFHKESPRKPQTPPKDISAPVDNKKVVNSVDTVVQPDVTDNQDSRDNQVNQKTPSGNLSLEQMRQLKVDYSVIRGAETVIDGSRLTMISLRAYGDKRFWIHIFLANRDQLSNPAQISTGMVIKIPKLDKRLIDASNPDCLQYAKELESQYVK